MSRLRAGSAVQRGGGGRALAYAAIALAASSWGTWSYVLHRVEAIGRLSAALESTIVMAVMTVVCGFASLRDAARRRSWSDWACVAWFGVGDILNVLLFFAAYKLTVAVAVLTHYLTPIFVAIGAPLVLRERVTSRTTLAVGISLAGLAVMLAHSGGRTDSPVLWKSAALGTASAVFYASNVLVNKRLVAAFSSSQALFWHGVVATGLGLCLVPPASWAEVDPRAAGVLAVVAVGPGALAGLAFVWALRRMPAAHASTLTLLEPLVAVLIGASMLGERVGPHTIAGGALILTGAVLVMTQPSAPPPAEVPEVPAKGVT